MSNGSGGRGYEQAEPRHFHQTAAIDLRHAGEYSQPTFAKHHFLIGVSQYIERPIFVESI
ncbi:hypothetical protein [Mycobacterium sp. ST-F2]|uniref:hypothetical protein n=1 Tax=Mycobacterium sp. ST-F2 TaxID=1490484 RepID=UPI00115037F7|nr:hypothetical protein [Mycobacterium sp. ST-F2]